MTKGHGLAVVVTMAVGLGWGGAAWADELQPTIAVTVANRCTSEFGLDTVKRVVEEAYDAVGVDITWRNEGSTTPAEADANLRLVLVAAGDEHNVLSTLQVPKDVLKTVVGMAPTPSRTAYVFCARVARRAAGSRTSTDLAIGRAAAHELGHLVLPAMGHSDSGIMRGSLDVMSLTAPRFTEEQGASIRGYLTDRVPR